MKTEEYSRKIIKTVEEFWERYNLVDVQGTLSSALQFYVTALIEHPYIGDEVTEVRIITDLMTTLGALNETYNCNLK